MYISKVFLYLNIPIYGNCIGHFNSAKFSKAKTLFYLTTHLVVGYTMLTQRGEKVAEKELLIYVWDVAVPQFNKVM